VNSREDDATLPPPPPSQGPTVEPGVLTQAAPVTEPSGTTPAARRLAALAGYTIEKELGRGGMGVVYQARQAGLNRTVALKMILSGGHASNSDLDRFRSEAEAIARLQHPNIVQIHEVGEVDGLPYFSLEFCKGGSLDRRLHGNPMLPQDAAKLVETLARAMQVAHDKNIVHRDLKPANVLLTEDGTPKITDFGLAKKLGEVGKTATGAIMGTPSYMAPEQAGGSKSIGPACDIYSLGAILYECLAGIPPFRAATPYDTVLMVMSEEPVSLNHLNRQVPRDLDIICLKCLRKESGQRYQRASDLAEDLARYQRGEPIAARSIGQMERARRWCRRYPMGAALVGLLALVIFAAIVIPIEMAAAEHAAALALEAEQTRTQQALLVSQDNEKSALAEKQKALREAAEATAERAIQLCDNKELTAGLLWFVHAAELARAAGARDLEEAMRWNIGAWVRETHYLEGMPDSVGGVTAVAYTADGETEYRGYADGRVEVFKGSMRTRLPDSATGSILALARHPSKPFLAATSTDGLMRVWDLERQKTLWTARFRYFGSKQLTFNHGYLIQLAYSPNGAYLVTGEAGSSVRLWDSMTGKPVRELTHQAGAEDVVTSAVAFSPTGDRVLVANHNARATIFETQTGKELDTFTTPSGAFAAAWSPDGKRIATAHGHDASVIVWDAKTGKPLSPRLQHSHHVNTVAFSADGTRLLSSCTIDGEGHVHLWDAATFRPVGPLVDMPKATHTVALLPDGKRFDVVDADGAVYRYRIAPTELLWCRSHPAYVLSLTFTPDSKELVVGMHGDRTTAKEGRQLHRWNRDTGKAIEPFYDGNPDRNNMAAGLAFSRDGKLLHVISHGTLSAWETNTATMSGEVSPREAGSNCYGFTRNKTGTFAVSNMINPDYMCLWDLVDAKAPVKRLATAPLDWRPIAFNPVNDDLWVGTRERTIQRFEAKDGFGHAHSITVPVPVREISFRSDGKCVALAGNDHTIRQWDVATQQPTGPVIFHYSQITCLAYSTENELLLSGSVDGLVQQWHPATGLRVGPQMHHTSRIEALEVSPDGRSFATGSYADKLVCMWKRPTAAVGEPEALKRWIERLTRHTIDAEGHVLPITYARLAVLLKEFPDAGVK